ncbi:MAG TPA: hypothetical protein VF146_17015 [Bryobacteraceae bacterium]
MKKLGSGIFNKRVGTMYNDNSNIKAGPINQAVAIDPFNVTNLFLNYTIRGESRWTRDQGALRHQ